jgi:hypothetical protein
VFGGSKDYVAEWRCGTSNAVYRASLDRGGRLGIEDRAALRLSLEVEHDRPGC